MGLKRVAIKWGLLILCGLLLISSLPNQAFAEESDSLWRECVYTSTNPSKEGLRELWDTNSSSDFIVKGPGELTIAWDDQVSAQSLYLEWNTLPDDFTLTQNLKDGSGVEPIAGETYELNQLYDISKDTRSITLASQSDMDICTAVIYGPNKIPPNYHPWHATPEKLDYLVIVTHPDDDVIFMGAIVPIYGVERGLNGTILYTCTSNIRYRCNEALNGAWVLGLRNHPIFASFSNILPSQSDQRANEFSVRKLTLYYVRTLRRYRPEVVVTHDKKGEYGHWQHKNVCAAVCEAVTLAADASYDPESVTRYGTFQVKKLYLHLFPENKIELDVLSPLPKCDNKSVIDISKAAYEEHISQVKADHYSVTNEGVYSLADYGLFFSAVGSDTGAKDLFEHIDPESLSNYIPPTPTLLPTKTPLLTPVVTLPTNNDLATAELESDTSNRSTDWLLYLLIALLILVICIGGALAISVARKHYRKQ